MATPDTATVGRALTLDASHQRQQMVRAIVASAVGTSIEWYDFFLYGVAAALVFPQKYFPQSDPFVGTLLSFSTYFVGFVARPIGAVIFGHFGDRVGRKSSLIATLVLMGTATMGIGFVPDYNAIGIWGGILLTVGRVIQGIGVGGEWGGSVLLAGEWTDPKRRGFSTSWAQFGAPAGMLLANGALALMTLWTTNEQFLEWGWRVPFLLSFVLIFIGLYIRAGILETPVFARLKTEGRVQKAPISRSAAARQTSGNSDCTSPNGPADSFLYFYNLRFDVCHAGTGFRPDDSSELRHDSIANFHGNDSPVRSSFRRIWPAPDHHDWMPRDGGLPVRVLFSARHKGHCLRFPRHRAGPAVA